MKIQILLYVVYLKKNIFTFFNFEFSFCRSFFDVIGRYLCKFLEINIHFKVLCRGGRPNSQIICNWTHISIPDRESIVPVFENLKKVLYQSNLPNSPLLISKRPFFHSLCTFEELLEILDKLLN